MMDIKEVKSKNLYKEYSLVIPFEEIDHEINQKITNLIPTITIPGFRKGKAPLNIVKKKYEDKVLNEVIQNIVNLKTNNLVKEKKFKLFRQPKINLKKYEKNQPVEIDIKIDLQPEIKLQDFKKINHTKYEINLSKKFTDQQYENFIGSQKNYKKINNKRLIAKTDRVYINFNTKDNSVPEYLKSQKNIPIDVALDQNILPNLSNELIGKFKEGDKKNIIIDLSKLLKNDKLKKNCL